MHRFSRNTLLLAALLALAAPMARADCGTEYKQAMSMLDEVKQQVLDNKHPDPNVFQDQFSAVVQKMTAENCMNELMSLFQYVQSEQQKYPAPGGNANAPGAAPAAKGKPDPVFD